MLSAIYFYMSNATAVYKRVSDWRPQPLARRANSMVAAWQNEDFGLLHRPTMQPKPI